MDPYQSEEEQIAQLKKWWQEQGQSVLMTVAVLTAAYVGYNGWTNHVASSKMAASVQYHQLLETVTEGAGAPNADPAQRETVMATASHLTSKLKEEHASSIYSHYAALLLAKQYVDSKQLDQAATELDWVLAQKPEADIAELATLRLARIRLTQEQPEAALSLIDQQQVEAYPSMYQALRGDIALSQGDSAKAGEYYQAAVDLQEQAGVQVDRVLKMKADALAPVDAALLVQPAAQGTEG